MDISGMGAAGAVVAGAMVVLALVARLATTVVKRRRARSRAEEAVMAQASRIATFESAVADYEESIAVWERRRDQLAALVAAAVAEAPGGIVPFGLQPGERVLLVTEATLEGYDIGDAPVRLAITDQRLVMDSGARLTWSLEPGCSVRQVEPGRTMVRVGADRPWVALSYPADAVTGLYLELATCGAGRSRDVLAANLTRGLEHHELRRPVVPTPPEPVPGLSEEDRDLAEKWTAEWRERVALLRIEAEARRAREVAAGVRRPDSGTDVVLAV